ncbi:MAG: glucosaminidase domain-containing protein [Paraprevotella sp.]|nr:glucosaminidase domain-containing protein [Paraprevotella sp.]
MKFRISFLFLILWAGISFLSAQKVNVTYQNYIDTYKGIAVEQMLKHRIPASVTLAQALLESGAGKSRLAIQANNHFGIKCGGEWNGPYIRQDDDAKGEKFRVYRNVTESYEDHSRFLKRTRYASLFTLSIYDYKGWCHGLKKCGYATNPQYATRLIDIIQLYELHKYDKIKSLREIQSNRHSEHNLTDETISAHRVYRNNGNYYVLVKSGDKLEQIAAETGVSPRRLRKYNELPTDYVPCAGDVIYLEKKKRRAERSFRKKPHIVQPGESMHRIAQRYGIRLESLYKMNKLSPDYEIQPAARLRVR